MGKRSVPCVVVVDPDFANCMLVREICQVGGWNVAGYALDVSEGVALIQRTAANCLFTEYKFGGAMTGLDLIATARRHVPGLFTVMLTGWDINDIATRVTIHQPDRILRKPVPPHVVMELLRSVHGRIPTIRIEAV